MAKNRGPVCKTIMDRLKIEDTKCENDLNVFFEINTLDEIVLIEEVEEYIAEFKELSKTYRHIHLELTIELGEAYVAQCPNYNKNSKGYNSRVEGCQNQIKEH